MMQYLNLLILSLIISIYPSLAAASCATNLPSPSAIKYDSLVALHSKLGARHHNLVLTIIQVESGFDSTIVSSAGAVGLMQLTHLAVIDAAEHCELKLEDPLDLTDPVTNIKLGTCYLDKLYKDTNSWIQTIVIYNGGYRQGSRLLRMQNLTSETSNYLGKIIFLMETRCMNPLSWEATSPQ